MIVSAIDGRGVVFIMYRSRVLGPFVDVNFKKDD